MAAQIRGRLDAGPYSLRPLPAGAARGTGTRGHGDSPRVRLGGRAPVCFVRFKPRGGFYLQPGPSPWG